MHVLVVSCVFPPEPVISARTSAEIAGTLVEEGHSVTVLAPFPSRPGGKLYPGYARRLFQRERSSLGVDVVRCFSTLSTTSSMLSRFLENLSFGMTGGWAALTAPRSDVIYANTWPVFATGFLSAIAWLRRVPLVLSVQDVYPESLVAQGRVPEDGLVARCIRWLDGLIARQARAVIVISERFAEIYRDGRRVDPRRVRVVPNWVNRSLIDVDDAPSRFRSQQGIPEDAFVVAYGGNIGVAAGVETVIQAFGHLKGVDGLHLVIAGEGSQLDACQELARAVPGQCIAFHTPWLAEETSQVLRAADVLVLPTQGHQSLSSMPSKLVVYMLAARPVIALALPQSDVAEIVQRAGCGWVVPPDQPEQLAAQIAEVAGLDGAELERRGRAGRAFALEHLVSEACLPQVVDILTRAAGSAEA